MIIATHNFRNIEDSLLVILSEKKLAAWLTERGRKVIGHKGRYWLETYPGFFSSLHPMAKMSAREASRPSPLCWGFRTALTDSDVAGANGGMPLHLLTDIENYTWESRTPRFRNKIRNLRKQGRIVELHTPALLLDQGYEIMCSAHARNGYGQLIKRREYQENVERYYASGAGLVLGGVIDGKLQGYMTSYAVGETAYVDELLLNTQALRTNIGLGLFYEWVQICRRSIRIRSVVHGLHAREAVGLCRYKAKLGLSVLQLPVRIWFAPLTGKIVQYLRPHAYYRLTGHD